MAASFILKVKKGSYLVNDQELWDEIKEKGDGAIVGIGQLDTNAPVTVIFSSILKKMRYLRCLLSPRGFRISQKVIKPVR